MKAIRLKPEKLFTNILPLMADRFKPREEFLVEKLICRNEREIKSGTLIAKHSAATKINIRER